MTDAAEHDKYLGEKRQELDKTFVEGDTGVTDLQPHSRLDAGMTGGADSLIGASGGKKQAPAAVRDDLPSGNEPIELGSGTVTQLIGVGGMAQVYKIWNEKLEVFRAVKILLPSSQSDLKRRFETEAKITAKLHHPNIAEIYNVGEWRGLPYLEMELIDGVSLESLITHYGKLPDPVCCAVGLHIAQALQYAHSRDFLIYGTTYHGIIHRDLKPANIMISHQGVVKLMDFGIARPAETSLHTVAGNIVGTMHYLSPEQLDGVEIDNRSDIYSFGTILYEMLTGTKTFPQNTITNLMKKKVLNDYRTFSEFAFSICPGLAKITHKCLQLSRTDRYPGAEELRYNLDKVYKSLSHKNPVQALSDYMKSPQSIPETVPKHRWFSLKLAVSAAVAIVAAGVVCITLLIMHRQNGNPPSLPESVAPVQAAPARSSAQVSLTHGPESPVSQLTPLVPSSVSPKTDIIRNNTSTETHLSGRSETLSSLPKPRHVSAERPVKLQEATPLEKLYRTYKTTDLLAIGKDAIKAQAYADAVTALENAPESPEKTMALLEAYIGANRMKDAFFIINNQSINDAQFDYLCARVYQILGKGKTALEYYENSLTKPSTVRDRSDIRNDALYQRAIILTDQYKTSPSDDSRLDALNAWNAIKRAYTAEPGNPRFVKANSEMAAIQ